MAPGIDVINNVVSGTIDVIFYLVLGLVLFVTAIVVAKKKKSNAAYNIPVTIIIPRSNNQTQDIVEAKGGYFKSKAVGGITTFRLKRKGVGLIDMPPPSSTFLMGQQRKLFLIQKGMDDFEPVHPKSWRYTEVENPSASGDTKGVAVIDLKCVNQDATAWKCDNEANALRRFTFSSFWEKYKDFIQITVFILIVFIASYVQFNGLKEVAESLKQVATSMNAYGTPIVS